jgi:hypothetical protein
MLGNHFPLASNVYAKQQKIEWSAWLPVNAKRVPMYTFPVMATDRSVAFFAFTRRKGK